MQFSAPDFYIFHDIPWCGKTVDCKGVATVQFPPKLMCKTRKKMQSCSKILIVKNYFNTRC